jgi:hypothetical protein
MLLRLVDHRFVQRPVRTRLPFKFGVQVLREVPLAELEITVETPDGTRGVGRAGDLLVPKGRKWDRYIFRRKCTCPILVPDLAKRHASRSAKDREACFKSNDVRAA